MHPKEGTWWVSALQPQASSAVGLGSLLLNQQFILSKVSSDNSQINQSCVLVGC